jgi:hypothetical protein
MTSLRFFMDSGDVNLIGLLSEIHQEAIPQISNYKKNHQKKYRTLHTPKFKFPNVMTV